MPGSTELPVHARTPVGAAGPRLIAAPTQLTEASKLAVLARVERGEVTMRRVRAFTLGFLLTGSLFPDVGGLALNAIASVVAAPLILFEFLRFLPRVHPVLLITTWVFAPLILAGLVWAQPAGAYGTMKFSMLWSSTLLCSAGAALIRDHQHLLTFARVWIGIGGILAIATLAFGVASQDRATGFGSNPIWLGRAMATAAIIALWLAASGKMRRTIAVGLVPILILGVLLTGSRGPTIGLISGAAILVIFAAEKRVLKIVGYGIAAAGLAAVLLSIPWLRQTRALGFLTGTGDEARSSMWDATLRVIADNPGGVGIGQWRLHAGLWFTRNYPHNLPLEVLAETGWVVGALLILTILSVIFRLAVRSRMNGTARLMLAVLTTELIAVCLSGDINARTFFAMLALGYAVVGIPGLGAINDPLAATSRPPTTSLPACGNPGFAGDPRPTDSEPTTYPGVSRWSGSQESSPPPPPAPTP